MFCIVFDLLQKKPTRASVKVGSTMYSCRRGEGVIEVTAQPHYSEVMEARIKITQLGNKLAEHIRMNEIHRVSMANTHGQDKLAFETAKEKFEACKAEADGLERLIKAHQEIIAAAERGEGKYKQETVYIPNDLERLTAEVRW